MVKSKRRRSSSSSRDTNEGTNDKFERKPFEGNRQDFHEFIECIKTAVMNRCDERGYRYLFPTNPWLYDQISNSFTNISEEYKIKADIPLPAHNATAAAIELYNSRQKIIDKHNSKFIELRSDVRSIISKRCGISLNKKFNEYGVDPLLIWKYLMDTFGSGTTTDLDGGDIAVDLGNQVMENNEHFSNWIREFEELASRCQASTIIKKGYLLSDGRGKLKTKLLPKRFDEAVRHCRQTRKTYDECKAYIEDSCNNDFARKIVTESTNLVTHAIRASDATCQGLKCHNCSNFGHFAKQCNTPICVQCAKCDHDWTSCIFRKHAKHPHKYDQYTSEQAEEQADDNGYQNKKPKRRKSRGRGIRGRSSRRGKSQQSSRGGKFQSNSRDDNDHGTSKRGRGGFKNKTRIDHSMTKRVICTTKIMIALLRMRRVLSDNMIKN